MSVFSNRRRNPLARLGALKSTRTRGTRRAPTLESLEQRQLLAANLDIIAGQLVYNGSAVNNNLNVSVTSPSGSGNYVFNDTGETITLSAAAIGLGWVGNGTNTVTGPDGSVSNILIDTDGGIDTVTVVSNTDPVNVDTAAGFPGEKTNIGDPVAGTVAGINGDIFVQDSGGQGAVSINDQNDSASRTVTFDNTQTISGALPGGHTIGFGAGVGTTAADPFTYNGPFGGNTITVNMPTVPANNFFLRINSGDGSDTVNVAALAATIDLDINTEIGGADATVIGSDNTLADILGSISVQDSGGVSSLTVDNSASAVAQNVAITNGTITGATAQAITYQPGVTTVTYDGGSGGDTVAVDLPTNDDLGILNVNTNDGDDTVNVLNVNAGLTANINTGVGTADQTNIGSTAPTQGTSTLAGIEGIVNVSDTDLAGLDVSDAGNAAPASYTITPSQITGSSFTGTITYTGANVSELVVSGGSGGNIFSITGTSSAQTTVNTGFGDDSTTVEATAAGAPLAIHGQAGTDDITIGNAGDISGIQGTVFIDNSLGFTDLTVDDSSGTTDRTYNLSGQDDSTLTTTGIADIVYHTFDISSMSLLAGGGSDTLTVDFNTGNPIPVSSGPGFGLSFDGGGGTSNVLNLVGDLPVANGGPFTDEVHNANGPGEGDITFTDSSGTDTSIAYSGLTPVNDVAVVTNYTFNDNAFPDGSFVIEDGNGFGGFNTGQIRSTTTPTSFETTNFANKTNVTFNTSNFFFGYNGTINLPTQPTGLANLTVNTITGQNDNITVTATPPNVTSNVNTGTGDDIVDVTGTGIAAGTTTNLDGGAGNFDTLNYDAGGLVPTITTGPAPGQVNITVPGAGTVSAVNFEAINFANLGPLTITPGAARTINSIEDFQLVDAIVSSFTVGPIPVMLPPGVTVNDPPASDFTASIDWGDPSVDADAGTILQDASDPSIYYVKGTHTYVDPGTFTAASTIDSTGSALTATIPGGPTLSFQFGAVNDAALANATVNVSNAALAVSAFPLAGVEGGTIAAGPIASFIDAGGSSGTADPSSAFSAVINLLDSTGATVLSVPAASITQNAASNSYTVNAPALSLAGLDEGTYSLRVTVTKTVNGNAVSATGGAIAVLSDAPLTAGAAVLLAPNTGVLLPNTTVVGNFTDANTSADASDFTAVIDWGDGSPTSLGTVAGGGGTFTVAGGHRYTRPGSYTTTIVVTDDGGSHVTLTGTATVTDLAVVAGAPVTIRGVEGQNTGTVVLGTFTDPNPLATASDVSATLSAWGDGTPGSPVPVAVQLIGSTATGALFEILGSHTYLEETAAAGVTIMMTVTTSGGVATPITATAIIADAPLSGSGVPVSGVEGNSTGTVDVATFTDADPNGTATDYTATISWGDGNTSAGTIVLVGGSPNGVVFKVTGSNTYAEAGSYPVSVTIADAGGAQTVAHSTATIVDAPLAAAPTQPTVTATEGQPFTGAVATFTDGNPTGTASDFNYVLIDWGDGSPMSVGTVTGPVGGPFTVSGTHTFANTGTTVPGPGTLPISVQVHDVDGATLTIANSATVNVASSTVTGQLNPASDTGLSTGTPNVTSVQTPNFFGTLTPAIPGETVTLTATNARGQTFQLGRATTNAAGDWNLTSGIALPTGTYAITAVATDPTGNVTSGAIPVTIVPTLVIDNVGPVVQNLVFNRGTGTILVTYSDAALSDGSAGSGVSLPSITDAANYQFTRPHTRANRFLITGITPTSTGVAGEQQVALTINNGRVIRGGFNFNFTIFATNNARPSGVEDRAENGMQGVFYGTFPSGNGINGTNFNARLVAFHNRVLPAMTNVGTARPVGGQTGAALFSARHRAALRHAAVHRHHH